MTAAALAQRTPDVRTPAAETASWSGMRALMLHLVEVEHAAVWSPATPPSPRG